MQRAALLGCLNAADADADSARAIKVFAQLGMQLNSLVGSDAKAMSMLEEVAQSILQDPSKLDAAKVGAVVDHLTGDPWQQVSNVYSIRDAGLRAAGELATPDEKRFLAVAKGEQDEQQRYNPEGVPFTQYAILRMVELRDPVITSEAAAQRDELADFYVAGHYR